MSDERIPLSACVTAATRLSPLITRGVINAAHGSRRSLRDRQLALSAAIRSAKLLLEELQLQQTRLGWRDREGDAA